jgi:hypothetical protein
MEKKTQGGGWRQVFLILVLGLVLTLANSINGFFDDIKEKYLKKYFRYQILMYFFFWAILIGLLYLCVYLYSGTFDASSYIVRK